MSNEPALQYSYSLCEIYAPIKKKNKKNNAMLIIPLTISFQIDPDKTKSGGADDNVSDNVSYVSMIPSSCQRSITNMRVIMTVNIWRGN